MIVNQKVFAQPRLNRPIGGWFTSVLTVRGKTA
jgi:hypothetical protein